MLDKTRNARLSLAILTCAACSGDRQHADTASAQGSAANSGAVSTVPKQTSAADGGKTATPAGTKDASPAGSSAAGTTQSSSTPSAAGAPSQPAAASGGHQSRTPAGSGAESPAITCSRELLQDAAQTYFKALAAHDPKTLPLSSNAKLTENGMTQELGKAGLWLKAGAVQHAHYALDVEQCSIVGQAVVPDDGTPIPVALRLKLAQQQITEIEMIAVRKGDYTLASNTDALSASAMTVHWEDPVPPDQRNTGAELTAWMDKYFRMFPRGVCNTTSDCKRIENGGGSFNCSAGASCADAQPGANDKALEPRLILVDVERGLGVGFTMFQANTDMHMFKMYGGKVYGVSAILGKASNSGWP